MKLEATCCRGGWWRCLTFQKLTASFMRCSGSILQYRGSPECPAHYLCESALGNHYDLKLNRRILYI